MIYSASATKQPPEVKKKVFGFDAFGSFPEAKKETDTYDSMFPKLHDLNTGIGHSKKTLNQI